jgi:hypothetical protein
LLLESKLQLNFYLIGALSHYCVGEITAGERASFDAAASSVSAI